MGDFSQNAQNSGDIEPEGTTSISQIGTSVEGLGDSLPIKLLTQNCSCLKEMQEQKWTSEHL